MKKLLLILLIGIAGTTGSFGQDIIQEAYFHELKGMEDSSGVTHLFYRFYKKSLHHCAPGNDNDIVEHGGDDVFHYNADTKSDSIIFNEGYGEWCLAGMYDSYGVRDYAFYDKDPPKWIKFSYFEYTYGISDYLGNELNIQQPIVVKQNPSESISSYWVEEFYLSPNNDSLYIYTGSTIPFAGRSTDWPDFEDYEDFFAYADSAYIDLKVFAIHPDIDSLYFATDEAGDLYRSEHYSQNFTLVDSNGYYENLFFDADTSHIYSISKYSSKIAVSDNLGSNGSWKFSDPDFKGNPPHYLTVDPSESGHVFISDSTDILFSDNHGDTFSSFLSIENGITGLYKKPDSDILYVLTRKELLEVNTQTKQTTSLKQLPVSNEQLPSLPKQVKLSQNYPNPFNPTTSIMFILNNNGHVLLEVYDALGKKVQTLVNGYREAGNYYVHFDAKQLASGIYFYRLEADGEIHTKRMTLIK